LASTSPAQQGKGESPQFKSIWWPILGGLAVTTAGGVKYVHDHLGGTEGVYRSASFYTLAIPSYIEYRYHMYMQSPDHVWEELDRKTSAKGLVKLLELKGFYVKCGQMCSANIGNAFPPVWQDTMSVLQDQVPPQPFHIVEEIVKSELDFDKVFASFEKTSIGSAAIGQVHRATLKDGTA
jgi:predicted unusual protein kinase regulating ubiquinone biosynthesis (AarF/ABC1/UbiB family)